MFAEKGQPGSVHVWHAWVLPSLPPPAGIQWVIWGPASAFSRHTPWDVGWWKLLTMWSMNEVVFAIASGLRDRLTEDAPRSFNSKFKDPSSAHHNSLLFYWLVLGHCGGGAPHPGHTMTSEMLIRLQPWRTAAGWAPLELIRSTLFSQELLLAYKFLCFNE